MAGREDVCGLGVEVPIGELTSGGRSLAAVDCDVAVKGCGRLIRNAFLECSWVVVVARRSDVGLVLAGDSLMWLA